MSFEDYSIQVIDEEMAGRYRYQKYVNELGWEKPNKSGIELDGFDPDSIHVALLDGKEIKAYCRLVDGYDSFPCKKFVTSPIHSDPFEISRIISTANDMRAMPTVVLFAYQLFRQISKNASMYMLLEDKFAHFLKRCGCSMEDVGPQIEHRGLRTPLLCKDIFVPKFFINVQNKVDKALKEIV